MTQKNINFQFLNGGKAEFTVYNPQGVHYTFKVADRSWDGHDYKAAYVRTDKNKYIYMGVVRKDGLHLTQASIKKGFTLSSESVQVFNWIHKVLRTEKNIKEGYGAIHIGKCCRCGRKLTHQDSIETGIGPECIKKMR